MSIPAGATITVQGWASLRRVIFGRSSSIERIGFSEELLLVVCPCLSEVSRQAIAGNQNH